MAKKPKRKPAKKPAKKRTAGTSARPKTRRPKRAAKLKRRGKTKARAARPRAARRPRKRTGARRRTVARRVAGTRRPARAVPRRAPTLASAAAPLARAAAAPATDDLRAQVVAQLTMRGYDADRPALADVLTAVAAGYREGPASAPAWLRVDVNKALAEGTVERYETGDRSPGPDRVIHRAQVRSMVDANLSLLGLAGDTGDAERDVLTTFCLGSWEPGMMTNAERDGIPSFVIPWYRNGR